MKSIPNPLVLCGAGGEDWREISITKKELVGNERPGNRHDEGSDNSKDRKQREH